MFNLLLKGFQSVVKIAVLQLQLQRQMQLQLKKGVFFTIFPLSGRCSYFLQLRGWFGLVLAISYKHKKRAKNPLFWGFSPCNGIYHK